MRELLRLALRNCIRHPLRTGLTVLGISIALLAFFMIRSIIDAWYLGVSASAKNRLVTRNAVSLVVPLPLAYRDRIAKVEGVRAAGYGNWFGGVYKDPRNRFSQFAIDDTYLEVYPEYVTPPQQLEAFRENRRGALIGAQLAEKYGFKVGDPMVLKGTIVPGTWEFQIEAIFAGRDERTLTNVMFFHWEFLNERIRAQAESNRLPDTVGFYVMEIDQSADPAAVSKRVDALFQNSTYETLTETETAFQQSFVSMSSNILLALNAICGVVIAIILLVLTNTMVMGVREQYREFAILRSIGFRLHHLAIVILGEALFHATLSIVLLVVLLVPVFQGFSRLVLTNLAGFFPVFPFSWMTLTHCVLIAIGVSGVSCIPALLTVTSSRVAAGLRRIG